jgi:uncharacterized protein (TIGR01777 family)
MGKIVVAGGTGFLGKALAEALLSNGSEVVLLTRGKSSGPKVRSVEWDGHSLGNWAKEIAGAQAIVNLSGHPVSVPWSSLNRKLIFESRVDSTRVIGEAISQTNHPPAVWINGSAVGIYGNRGDEVLDESSKKGVGFLPDVCSAWEQAVQAADCPDTRRVELRTGVVLGRAGGAYVPLRDLTRAYFGGHVGDGRQWVPWIHVQDWVNLVLWVIEQSVEGPINAVSPNPVRNLDLMQTLRKVIRRPWSPPVPAFGLAIVSKFGGPDPSVLLDSMRVIPAVALEHGLEYEFPTLDLAISDLR